MRTELAFSIIGTHGRGETDRFPLGDVADRVGRPASCQVLVAPDIARSAG